MASVILAVLQFIFGLFGFEKKADPVKEAGANEQRVTDISAAYDELAKTADARADSDVDRVSREPGSDQIDPDAAKDYPGLKYRD